MSGVRVVYKYPLPAPFSRPLVPAEHVVRLVDVVEGVPTLWIEHDVEAAQDTPLAVVVA